MVYGNSLGDDIMIKEDWIKFSKIKTIDDLEHFSSRYNNNELVFESIQHEISFLYNLGLYYSEHLATQFQIDAIFRKEDKYYLAIYYYLKAIKLYEENSNILDDDINFVFEIIRRLYVNIANELSNQFRSIDALSYYRKALEIDCFFDMAIGNFALGIEHHTPLIGLEQNKHFLVYNMLWQLYFTLNIGNLDSGKEFFISKKQQYPKPQRICIDIKKQKKSTECNSIMFFTEIDYFDKSYENWCINNTLFLNFVNDLGNFEEAKFDINVKVLSKKLDLSEARQCSLNNLFELFVFQRKKIFKCVYLDSQEILLELAQTFQCLYSYFDKVAFFLYKFFGLIGKERNVNINSIWNMKDFDGNYLTDYKNQYLYNIYWLRKEYREKSPDGIKINELLSPDAQEYAEIRNTLEHKEFSFTKTDGLLYINPKTLYDKTIKLAKVVRNMILSLFQLVKTEKMLVDSSSDKRNLDLVYLEYEGFK